MKMNENKRIPGEYVKSVTVAEVLKSAGIQLALWSHDIAFTDAAFGETWAVETADRMATLSELLHDVYLRLNERTKELSIDLPRGITGQIQINPNWKADAEKPRSSEQGDSDNSWGIPPSLDDFPF